MGSHRSMIFHHPFPLPDAPTSGSQVRLTKMVEAFHQIGFQVKVVAGFADERKVAIQQLKAEQREGKRFDFLYSESSALPSLMAKGNLGHIQLDFGFFRWCRKQSIPVGLFYRDLHWRFAQFKRLMSWNRRPLALILYWYDWLNYQRCVDHLFLPSLAMRKALPGRWPESQLSALFPGCSILNETAELLVEAPSQQLELLYVGGVTPPLYDLKPMLDSLRGLDGVHLTLCCRAREWAQAQPYYAPFDQSRIDVVHAQDGELDRLYLAADLFALTWRPNPYLEFAMPVKLFESLGHGVPMITTEGTETARLVRQEGIGWTVSSRDELRGLLTELRADRPQISAVRAHVRKAREHHTWRVRAQTAAMRLSEQTAKAK